MARGFESKDVEFQQAEAEARRMTTARTSTTPADREREAARRTLELALASALAQRASATHAVHQRMLDEAIQSLKRQLAADQ